MSLILPPSNSIHLDPVSAELDAQVHALAQQVRGLRPLTAACAESVYNQLLGERVFNSNAIEGNSLTLRETRAVLQASAVIDVGRQREAIEALNLASCIRVVQELTPARDRWTDLRRLGELHAILMRGIDDEAGGRSRHERVMIAGAKHQPPPGQELELLLGQFSHHFSEGLAAATEPLVLAVWVHWALARIHPFRDGNGRLARLWQDLVLFGHGLTAGIIRKPDRTRYYSALGSADEGEMNPLFQLVARGVGATLQVYLDIAGETGEVREWRDELIGEWPVQVPTSRLGGNP